MCEIRGISSVHRARDGCSQIPAPAAGVHWGDEPRGVRGRTATYLFAVTLFCALQPTRDFNASLSFDAFLSPPFICCFDAPAPRQDRHTITKLMEGKWHLGELDLVHARQAN